MRGIIYCCFKQNDKKVFEVKQSFFQKQPYLEPLKKLNLKNNEFEFEKTQDFNIFGTRTGDYEVYCVSNVQYPLRLCTDFLTDCKKIHSLESLQQLIKRYNDPKADIILECEDLLESTKRDAFTNIDVALERGKGMERLINSVDNMENVSFQMSKKSSNINSSMDCQSWTLLFSIFCVIILFILLVTFVLIFKYLIFK